MHFKKFILSSLTILIVITIQINFTQSVPVNSRGVRCISEKTQQALDAIKAKITQKIAEVKALRTARINKRLSKKANASTASQATSITDAQGSQALASAQASSQDNPSPNVQDLVPTPIESSSSQDTSQLNPQPDTQTSESVVQPVDAQPASEDTNSPASSDQTLSADSVGIDNADSQTPALSGVETLAAVPSQPDQSPAAPVATDNIEPSTILSQSDPSDLSKPADLTENVFSQPESQVLPVATDNLTPAAPADLTENELTQSESQVLPIAADNSTPATPADLSPAELVEPGKSDSTKSLPIDDQSPTSVLEQSSQPQVSELTAIDDKTPTAALAQSDIPQPTLPVDDKIPADTLEEPKLSPISTDDQALATAVVQPNASQPLAASNQLPAPILAHPEEPQIVPVKTDDQTPAVALIKSDQPDVPQSLAPIDSTPASKLVQPEPVEAIDQSQPVALTQPVETLKAPEALDTQAPITPVAAGAQPEVVQPLTGVDQAQPAVLSQPVESQTDNLTPAATLVKSDQPAESQSLAPIDSTPAATLVQPEPVAAIGQTQPVALAQPVETTETPKASEAIDTQAPITPVAAVAQPEASIPPVAAVAQPEVVQPLAAADQVQPAVLSQPLESQVAPVTTDNQLPTAALVKSDQPDVSQSLAPVDSAPTAALVQPEQSNVLTSATPVALAQPAEAQKAPVPIDNQAPISPGADVLQAPEKPPVVQALGTDNQPQPAVLAQPTEAPAVPADLAQPQSSLVAQPSTPTEVQTLSAPIEPQPPTELANADTAAVSAVQPEQAPVSQPLSVVDQTLTAPVEQQPSTELVNTDTPAVSPVSEPLTTVDQAVPAPLEQPSPTEVVPIDSPVSQPVTPDASAGAAALGKARLF